MADNTQTHFTPKQLAERWHMSVATLACWRSKGGGPCYVKWGKNVLYAAAVIEQWEQDHSKNNTAQ